MYKAKGLQLTVDELEERLCKVGVLRARRVVRGRVSRGGRPLALPRRAAALIQLAQDLVHGLAQLLEAGGALRRGPVKVGVAAAGPLEVTAAATSVDGAMGCCGGGAHAFFTVWAVVSPALALSSPSRLHSSDDAHRRVAKRDGAAACAGHEGTAHREDDKALIPRAGRATPDSMALAHPLRGGGG